MDENPYKAPEESLVERRESVRRKDFDFFIRWFSVGVFILYPVLFGTVAIVGSILGWFP